MMALKKCKSQNCPGDHYARGYCRKCYRKVKNKSDFTNTLEMAYDIIKGECMLDCCDEQLFIHGLCIDHFNEIAGKGYIDAIKEEKETCRVKDCGEDVKDSGLCEGHHEDFMHVHACSGQIRKSIGERIRKFEVREVKLKDIKEDDNKFKIRYRLDPDRVARMASTIATNGLIHPLALLEEDDGYVIISGFYRYAAHELLVSRNYDEFETVDAKVIPNGVMREEDIIKMAMDENFKRNYVSVLEKAIKAEELRFRYSIDEVADLMGTNTDNVKKFHRILEKAARPVMEALHNDQLSLNVAYRLLKMDKEKQTEWLHKVLKNQMSESELQNALAEKKREQFEQNFQNSLENPSFPLKKEGRGTYVIDGMKLNGIDSARKLYRLLQNNNIDFE
ncbi:MAG: ParB/RepB/Spo0J family partition protein [Flavobacteriales bacterium]